jgi:Cof subfamily protein (haloacid dehalogenase superfamily)
MRLDQKSAAGRPEPKLLISDLDGTLLDPDHILRPRTRAMVRALREGGVEVVLASGRIPPAMESICRELELDGPQITSHGAMVVSPLSGEIVSRHPLGEEDVRAHLAFAEEVGTPAVLCYEDGFKVERMHPGIAAIFEPYDEPLPEVVPDLDALVSSEPLKVYLFTQTGQYAGVLAEARARFHGRNTVTSGDELGVEFLAPDANKETAAGELAAAMGLDMHDVAAIGDGPNDVALLRTAGISAAMAHASDEVRSAATFVVPGNRDEGAVLAMTRMFPSIPVPEVGEDAGAGRRHGPVRARG